MPDLLASFPVGELAALAAALVVAGIAAGILAGLLGVGGGIVIVPVLYHMFSAIGVEEAVRMHVAVGTSLGTIIPTSIVSARAHLARGGVDTDLLRRWAPFIALGVVAGTVLGGNVRGEVLTAIFAVVALAVALNMGLRKEGAAIAAALPRAPFREAIAFVIGLISVMMGIGGGTLSVPILGAFSYPIRRAIGTAAAIGLIIAVPGAIGYAWFGLDVAGRPPFSLGYVNLVGLLLIVPATVATAPLGARLAHTMDPSRLKLVFAAFLLATSVRMFVDLAG
jgi:uncharacterized membrane protein YfcA